VRREKEPKKEEYATVWPLSRKEFHSGGGSRESGVLALAWSLREKPGTKNALGMEHKAERKKPERGSGTTAQAAPETSSGRTLHVENKR